MKSEGRGHIISALVLMLQAAICVQLFIANYVKCGDFVREEGVVLSPTQLCVQGMDSRMECAPLIDSSLALGVVVFCVNAPVALTLFAGLGHLFGACLRDVDCLLFSLVTQALAATAMFAGIAPSVVALWRLVWPLGLTAAFHLSACACVEMGVATLLCWVSVRRLTS